MWVCKQHITVGLERLTAPHIQKAPAGMTCSFCEQKAELNMYYAHKPLKLKSTRSSRNSNDQVRTSNKQVI